jgi:hypothetical protein
MTVEKAHKMGILPREPKDLTTIFTWGTGVYGLGLRATRYVYYVDEPCVNVTGQYGVPYTDQWSVENPPGR